MSFFKKLFGKKEKPKEQLPKKEQSEAEWEEEIQRMMEALAPHKRTAYRPQVEKTSRSFSPDGKIGGYPYLRHENDWPICPSCQKHMQLFLQLNLTDLPEREGTGLVQLFYCTNSEPLCESDLQAFFPFSKAVVCRKVTIDGESAQIEPKRADVFAEQRIVGWKAVDDYPHYEEHQELGIEEFEDEVYDLMDEREIGIPVQGDKLFGWPYWVQSAEYPYDRESGSRMELLFQFDSEDNLPYMFGDAGIGHLTQSPDNEQELGFGWACS
ncbi:MAG: DUF1963 domain-containing protein [Bacteroidota bacterium]